MTDASIPTGPGQFKVKFAEMQIQEVDDLTPRWGAAPPISEIRLEFGVLSLDFERLLHWSRFRCTQMVRNLDFGDFGAIRRYLVL
mgnify:CR=1 FL=1